ncbi:hypothetical protein CWC38_09675 [Kocuria tytonicola]|uniref:DUF3099 domain-containing protein n=1 Tax=Kocuria tytonicola TaxID=2055946 RepID=UPI000EF91DA0|nr:DUF3099 domain-containing protein [Kocuria tytonicola]RLZ02707.1 hypothetical protein CWC38_09675 [Kocuria tytonicola]
MTRSQHQTHGSTEVHSITSAADPHTTDMAHRMKVYSVQMGLRIVCIIGAVLIDNLWVRVLLIAGAALLPWFAVMLANRGADRSERPGSAYRPPAAVELPTVAETQDRAAAPETVVVDAEYTVHRPQRELPAHRPTATRRN